MFYFRLFLNVSFEWGFSKELFCFLFPVQICVSIINRLLEVVLYKLGHLLHRYWRTEEEERSEILVRAGQGESDAYINWGNSKLLERESESYLHLKSIAEHHLPHPLHKLVIN